MDFTDQGRDLERRKQVRLRLRADLKTEVQTYEGRTYHVVKDSIGLRYYWFTEQEYFVLRLLDGRHTLDQAQKAFEERFRPERLRLEEVEGFGQQLLTTGLAYYDSPRAGKQLYERRQKRRLRERLAAWTNILSIKVPFYDPDRLLGRILPYLRWAFTPAFVMASAALMVAALLLIATHFEDFQAKLPGSRQFFRFQTVMFLWAALAVVKVVHEFGHGLACKVFGGEVHEMGLLFICLTPSLYCNVSDAWTLPQKRRRILISFAGIYVELLIAALAALVWWNTPGQTFLSNLCLSLMVVCSVNTVVLNGNLLLRYDGYYVLAAWLEIPNLRQESNRFLKNAALEHCLGVEVPPEPAMALGRRVLFAVYAVASYVYRWLVTFGMLYFMYMFLRPYKLGAISALLAAFAAGSMVGWPLYYLGKGLHQRGGRLPEMKPKRASVCAGVVAALLLAFFLVPLPISRVRRAGLVEVRPEAMEKVFVPVPGILERLHVRNGQQVARGDILAEFSSLELENRLSEALTQHDIRGVQLQELREQAEDTTDAQERAKVQVTQATTGGERERFGRQAEVYTKMSRRLVLLAPRAGVVMGLPRREEVGKLWEKDQATPFCSIGDPRKLRALMPVSPADYRLLREDLAAAREGGSDLAVTIRVRGLCRDTWQGKVATLPESEAKEVPLALTTQAGGPLAAKAGSRPQTFVPQSQHYLMAVDFLGHDPAICPGTQAKVKIHCRWRSGAWWVWRTVSQAFDLGLL